MPSRVEVRRERERKRYREDKAFWERKVAYQRKWRAAFKEEFGISANKAYGYIPQFRWEKHLKDRHARTNNQI